MDKTLLASVEERIAAMRRERDWYRTAIRTLDAEPGTTIYEWTHDVLKHGDRIRRGEDATK